VSLEAGLEAAVLTENVSLNFAKVKVAYKRQKPDGSGEPAKEFIWDIAANADQ
jgi:type VI secretion system secreted protein Hcp